jgi:hypothetical protein
VAMAFAQLRKRIYAIILMSFQPEPQSRSGEGLFLLCFNANSTIYAELRR